MKQQNKVESDLIYSTIIVFTRSESPCYFYIFKKVNIYVVSLSGIILINYNILFLTIIYNNSSSENISGMHFLI